MTLYLKYKKLCPRNTHKTFHTLHIKIEIGLIKVLMYGVMRLHFVLNKLWPKFFIQFFTVNDVKNLKGIHQINIFIILLIKSRVIVIKVALKQSVLNDKNFMNLVWINSKSILSLRWGGDHFQKSLSRIGKNMDLYRDFILWIFTNLVIVLRNSELVQ